MGLLRVCLSIPGSIPGFVSYTQPPCARGMSGQGQEMECLRELGSICENLIHVRHTGELLALDDLDANERTNGEFKAPKHIYGPISRSIHHSSPHLLEAIQREGSMGHFATPYRLHCI